MEEKKKSAVEFLESQYHFNKQLSARDFKEAKEMEISQATEYAKWSIEIYNLTGRFFTYSEWLKDDPKDQEDYEIIKSLNVPKQSVQEYEQQGLEKYSHELAEGKEMKKEEKGYSLEEVIILLKSRILEIHLRKENLLVNRNNMPQHLLEGGVLGFESSMDAIGELVIELTKKQEPNISEFNGPYAF